MEMKKCSSCELYNISNCEDLINNLLKIPGEKHITNINCKAFTCHMCCQNRTLLEHIKEQNEMIAGLRYRINSLTVIRNMECDIDDIYQNSFLKSVSVAKVIFPLLMPLLLLLLKHTPLLIPQQPR